MSTPVLSASRGLLRRSSRVIPGGVNTSRRNSDPPICIRRAQGARLEDVDGNQYLDYHAAYGAVFLGHSHPSVVAKVRETVEDAVLFGLGVTEAEVALAEKIVEHVPSIETVLLCMSGSDATFHAVRLARGVTARNKVVKFQGSFNGGNDYLLRNVYSTPEMVGKRDPASAGILGSVVDNTLVCRFNDLDDVTHTLHQHGEDVAAVVLEPVLHNSPGILPKPGFLEGLRAACDEVGALLIFDEIITGFRHHLGGYQAMCGVMPHLTAVGKALGNGFPVAAVGGQADVMEHFNTTADGKVHFAGTYNGNSVATAAALATIAELEDGRVYEYVFRLGDRMRDGLRVITERLGIPAIVSGLGSLVHLSFMEPPLDDYDDALRRDMELEVAYRRELLKRGVLMTLPFGRDHISASHTARDVDLTLEAVEESLHAALAQGATHGRSSGRSSERSASEPRS